MSTSFDSAMHAGGLVLFGLLIGFDVMSGHPRIFIDIGAGILMIGYAIGLARGMFELYEKPLPKYLGTMVSLLFMVIGLVIFVGAIFAGIIYASPLPVDISGANCHNIGGINEGAIYVCRYEGNLTMIAAQNETDARIATVMGKGTLVPKTYG